MSNSLIFINKINHNTKDTNSIDINIKNINSSSLSVTNNITFNGITNFNKNNMKNLIVKGDLEINGKINANGIIINEPHSYIKNITITNELNLSSNYYFNNGITVGSMDNKPFNVSELLVIDNSRINGNLYIIGDLNVYQKNSNLNSTILNVTNNLIVKNNSDLNIVNASSLKVENMSQDITDTKRVPNVEWIKTHFMELNTIKVNYLESKNVLITEKLDMNNKNIHNVNLLEAINVSGFISGKTTTQHISDTSEHLANTQFVHNANTSLEVMLNDSLQTLRTQHNALLENFKRLTNILINNVSTLTTNNVSSPFNVSNYFDYVPYDISLSNYTISKSSSSGTILGTINVSDIDNDTYIYEVKDDLGKFTTNSSTIITNNVLTDLGTSYKIKVIVKDDEQSILMKNFTIEFT